MNRLIKYLVIGLCLLFINHNQLIMLAEENIELKGLMKSASFLGSNIIDIPDGSLKLCINQELGKSSTASITKTEMRSITKLKCDQGQIFSIEGLQYATYLKSFEPHIATISDLSPLSNLDYLEEIVLNGWSFNEDFVHDLKPLAYKSKLTTLVLDETNVKDFSYISTLTNLKSLTLSKTNITDLSFLSNLNQLTTLNLNDNNLTNLKGIENLNNLENLYLRNNNLENTTFLSQLSNLMTLNLHSNKIKDVIDLQPLNDLQTLILSDNDLIDIDGIASLVNLKELNLSNNNINDISAIQKLINLENLNIQNNNISDISAIGNLTKLTDLNGQFNQISELNGLNNVTLLKNLYLNNNEIEDVSLLSSLKLLDKLYLSNNQISSISNLNNLTNLTTLKLNNNQISDMSVLNNFNLLTELDISNQYVMLANQTIKSGDSIMIHNPLKASSGEVKNIIAVSDGTFNSEENTIRFSTIESSRLLTYTFSTLIQIGNKSYKFNGIVTQPVDVLGEPSLSESVVNIPDVNLKEVIHKELEISTDMPLTKLDISKLTSLSAYSKQISNIEGLQYAVYLDTLSLGSNEIGDLTPLKSLVNLGYLSLSRNKIKDLSPLSNLKSLKELYLNSNQIEDVSPLSQLKSLSVLELNTNVIRDVSSLKNLTQGNYYNLNDLWLKYNQITDFTGIKANWNVWGYEQKVMLDEVVVQGTEVIIDLPVVYDVYGKEVNLKMERCPVTCSGKNNQLILTDLVGEGEIVLSFYFSRGIGTGYTGADGQIIIPYKAITNYLPTITASDITLTQGDDFDPFEDVIASDKEDGILTSQIIIKENTVNTKKGGTYKVVYEVTDSDENTVTKEILVNVISIEVEFKDENLKSVLLNDLGKEEDDFISKEEMEEIHWISAYDAGIKDLTGLEYAINLSHIELAYNQITDLSPLKNLENLRYVILDYNQITDLSPLKNSKDIALLSARDNTLTLDEVELNRGEELVIENPVVGIDGQRIKPTYTLGGSLDGNNIILYSYRDTVEIIFDKCDYNSDLSNQDFCFNGRVTIPLKINDKPVITVPSIITIEVGQLFNPLEWMSATDEEDGNLTANVLVKGDIDVNQPGTYPVTFEVSDSKGAMTKVSITVKVKTNNKPVINGISDITITVGDNFNPRTGVTATDLEDSDLTEQIVIDGKVDTENYGTYVLTYSVTDSDNNTIIVQRTVTVIASFQDLNQDGVLDEQDLHIIKSYYNVTSMDENWQPSYDFNEDGIIDLYDIVLISNQIK